MIAKNTSGKQGEKYAVAQLEKEGYKIICKNFRAGIAEIDVVAKDGDVLCFIEIKTRKSKEFGYASEAVDKRKIHKLRLGALSFMKRYPGYSKFRFDVVEVYARVMTSGLSVEEINIIKNAFDV